MAESIDAIYQTTLKALERDLNIGLIATWEPKTCRPSDSLAEMVELMQSHDFDHVPVLNESGTLIGVLETCQSADLSGTVDQVMKRVEIEMIVPSHQPLEQFILEVLPEDNPRSFRLVLGPDGEYGIVTRSDFHKLPVRMFAFALVSHLELSMSELIQLKSGDEDWWLNTDTLKIDRICRVKCEKAKVESKGDGVPAPHLIYFTQFCDKRDIIHKCLNPDSGFKSQMKKIERRLRDPIAHSNQYAGSVEELKRFAKSVQHAREWIDRLETMKYDRSSITS